MNHVAHCYLSFDDPDVLLGNFIGDFVKGRKWEGYPKRVQVGIKLHRSIDAYTDDHAVSKTLARMLRPLLGRYAPPVLDILFDHQLSVSWDTYSDESFDVFAARVFASLEERYPQMPQPLDRMWPRMLEHRFLYRYTSFESLDEVLAGFIRRIGIDADPEAVGNFYQNHFGQFEEGFEVFFPDLEAYVKKELSKAG